MLNEAKKSTKAALKGGLPDPGRVKQGLLPTPTVQQGGQPTVSSSLQQHTLHAISHPHHLWYSNEDEEECDQLIPPEESTGMVVWLNHLQQLMMSSSAVNNAKGGDSSVTESIPIQSWPS